MAIFRITALALHACLPACRTNSDNRATSQNMPRRDGVITTHTPIENMPELLERLKAARLKVAQLVLIDRVYLPIFERLEKEIVALERDEKLMERARELVRGVQSD